MKLRYKKWCREYVIPEQKVHLKFWLSRQYQKTRKELKALKEAVKSRHSGGSGLTGLPVEI